MPAVDVLPEQLLTEFIECGVGLVEQQHGRVGQAQSSEQGALQFATGQGHEWALLESAQVPVRQCVFQALAS
ncbi:hypothetical protein D3C78_1808280 [compost metagenome]